MYISSPGGYLYPRAVSWDVSAGDLELALEWTYDIGEVTVSYSEDANTTRNYRVTFEVGDDTVMNILPSCPSLQKRSFMGVLNARSVYRAHSKRFNSSAQTSEKGVTLTIHSAPTAIHDIHDDLGYLVCIS